MGKVEIDIHCYLTTDILTKVLQKCSLSSSLPTIWILSKPLYLIGCNSNLNKKFAKNYSKIFSSEAIRGMKLKFCRNDHNISLYKNYIFIAVALATYSFPRLLMEKWKEAFISFSLQIFWQKFSRNVPWVVLLQTMNFVQIAEFDWLPDKFAKIFKISSEAIRRMKLKLCRNVHNICFYKGYVFLLPAHPCRLTRAFVVRTHELWK